MAAWVLVITIWGNGTAYTPAITSAPMETEQACKAASDKVRAWNGSAPAYALCLKTKD